MHERQYKSQLTVEGLHFPLTANTGPVLSIHTDSGQLRSRKYSTSRWIPATSMPGEGFATSHGLQLRVMRLSGVCHAGGTAHRGGRGDGSAGSPIQESQHPGGGRLLAGRVPAGVVRSEVQWAEQCFGEQDPMAVLDAGAVNSEAMDALRAIQTAPHHPRTDTSDPAGWAGQDQATQQHTSGTRPPPPSRQRESAGACPLRRNSCWEGSSPADPPGGEP